MLEAAALKMFREDIPLFKRLQKNQDIRVLSGGGEDGERNKLKARPYPFPQLD